MEQAESISNTWQRATTSSVILLFFDIWRFVQMRAGRSFLKIQLHPYSSGSHIFLHTGFSVLFSFASILLDVVLIITWPPGSPNWTFALIRRKSSVFMKVSKSVSQKKDTLPKGQTWYKEENVQKHGRNATPLVKRFCCWEKIKH